MSAFFDVLKLAEEWQPEAFPTELKYHDSFVTLLRAKLEGTIETEYRHAGTTIDIYVKLAGFWKPSEVYIELKSRETCDLSYAESRCSTLRAPTCKR